MTSAAIDDLSGLEFRQSAGYAGEAAKQGDCAGFQAAVLRRNRSSLKLLRRILTPTSSSVLWSDSTLVVSDEDRELAATLGTAGKRRRSVLRRLLAAIESRNVTALVRLTALETLAFYGEELKSDDFAILYVLLASSAPVLAAEDPSAEWADRDFVRLTSEAELPWCINLFQSELKGHRTRRLAAARQLRKALEEATDNDGFLHGSFADMSDQWLAPFVRASLWGDAFGESWTGRRSDRLSDSIAHCVSLLIPNGLVCRPPSSMRVTDTQPAEIMRHAVLAAGYRRSSSWRRFVRSIGQRKVKSDGKARTSKSKNLCSQSDWALSALMRTGLHVDSDTVLLNWTDNGPTIHAAPLGTPLLSGAWVSEVTVNGTRANLPSQWTCTCWFTDHEAAFAELALESEPPDAVRLIRHVLLSLKDHICVVCESVTCPDAEAEIRLESRLPLAGDPLCVTNVITRELVLHMDEVPTRVVPAWLEDDRILHALGHCDRVDDQIVSTASGVGGVTMPLVFDWHPERRAADADWSRLTTTEERRPVSGQLAAGFRVRIGKFQLFVYRSLVGGAVPRAVLGQHTANETIYGRVKKSGEIAPLVLVEGEFE